MTTGLNPKYFVSLGLEDYLNDPSTLLPLASGYIECYVDTQRGTPKTVYQLSGNPPNYTYEALPNPVPLSPNGMPMNANGDIVKIYYYPFDDEGELQLYYLRIFNEDGEQVYEIQAIPNLADSQNPEESANVYENQLSNPQFVEVSFEPNIGISLSISGAVTSQVYDLAPDWQVIVSTNGASNIAFNQVALEGSLNVPTNSPYVLHVQSSGSVTQLQLVQKLSNNPNIWSSTTDSTGYVAGHMLVSSLDGLPHTVSMYYAPSVAPSPTLIVSGSTGISGYKQLEATVELPAGVNSQDGAVGYVDIIIDLPVNVNMYISSLQVIGLPADINVVYAQETSNRQRDHLFNYYEEPLKFKPIPSYLVGWDFPLNPAQFGESGTMGAIGGDTSKYAWDQTILFQSTTNSLSYARGAGVNSFFISATATTQAAIVQYIPSNIAREILSSPICSLVRAETNIDDGLNFTVSIFWTDSATLPDLNSNLSIVQSLDENGHVATTNGDWTEITRSNGVDATATMVHDADSNLGEYSFSGWNTEIDTDAASTATWLAIVVGTGELINGSQVSIQSVSLQSGSIPTIPAPQSYNAVLRDCQYTFQTTFPPGVPIGTITGDNALIQFQKLVGTSLYYSYFSIVYETIMAGPANVDIYPAGGTAPGPNVATWAITRGNSYVAGGTNPNNQGVDANYLQVVTNSVYGATFLPTTTTPVITAGSSQDADQGIINFHYVADARYGLVTGV